MMLLASKYASDSATSGPDAAGYAANAYVPKPGANGPELFKRDPVPEVLVNDPALTRAAIRVSPGNYKYRSLVMAFAQDDIDVELFNAGSAVLRGQVEAVLDLHSEIAFAGIPATCRPPIFVTTHTHCGNLELNILVPRWVRRPDGALRAFNPDPPGAAGRACWRAFEDCLNTAFRWSDPRDPGRRQWVRLPGWLVKQRASVLRSGGDWEPTVRERICDMVVASVQSGAVTGRDDLVALLNGRGSSAGIKVLRIGDDYLRIGAAGSSPNDRIRLRGLLFSKDFTGPDALVQQAAAPDEKARATKLADAAARLQTAWNHRAAFNIDRHGLGTWPWSDFDVARFVHRPRPPSPRVIPPRRIDRTPGYLVKDPCHDRSSDRAPVVGADSHGTGAPGPRRRPRAGAAPRPADTEREDRGIGGRDPGAGRGHRTLDRFADVLAGPGAPDRS